MPTVLLDRPATDAVLAAAEFKSDLHPRGPGGRFTKSFTKALTAAERKRADKAQAAFKAQEFDAASLKQWQGTHTPAQLAAIKRFAGGDWKTINGDLRAGHDTQHPDIAQLDASMHPLPHDVTLHRTVPLALFGGVDPEKLSGRKVKDAGYASTSIHEPAAGGGAVVRMHISAPAGTPAMPTGENGEVVLPRDQEMVIESVKADGHGGYDMQLTVLPKARTRTPAAPVTPAGPKKTAPAPKKTAPKAPAQPKPKPASKPKESSKPAAPAPEPAKPPKAAAKDLIDRSKMAAAGGIGARSIAEVDLAKRGQEIFGGTFGGIEATVTTANVYPGGEVIQFDGVVGAGEWLGKFQRIVGVDQDGEYVAIHELLTLTPSVQGQGFAEEFNANAEQWYRDTGISRIELIANINVGGYAWARAGYDFADEANREQKIRQLGARVTQYEYNATQATDDATRADLEAQIAAAKALIARAKAGEKISAYEISQVGRQPGATGKDATWIGKVLLIGSSWRAVKWL